MTRPRPSPEEIAAFDALLRQDLATFIERCFYELNPGQNFIRGPHIPLMAAWLVDCIHGRTPIGLRRLIVNMPPRHLKSISVSVALVAWLLGKHPEMRIICASYSQDLANALAQDTRKIMQSAWYRRVFGDVLERDRPAANDFRTIKNGSRFATSVGGTLTGRGGELIIIDDPLKPEEALSETQRNEVNRWYFNTLSSRVNDPRTGAIIVVSQRLHQNDLVGHLLDRQPGVWDVLSFPAIASRNEHYTYANVRGPQLFSRRIGEPLHPERVSLEMLEGIRAQVGEYNFESQYQQSPIAREGGYVKRKWLRYYRPEDLPTEFWMTVMSWDTANKAAEFNDYTVCTVWGFIEDRYYLLEVVRKRLEFPELRKEAIAIAQRYPTAKLLIEDKASGTQLIQELKYEVGNPITGYKPPPNTDKLVRLSTQTVAFESGNVYLPESAPWLDDYVDELTGFPGSTYADQVDSTTQALQYLRDENEPMLSFIRLGARLP